MQVDTNGAVGEIVLSVAILSNYGTTPVQDLVRVFLKGRIRLSEFDWHRHVAGLDQHRQVRGAQHARTTPGAQSSRNVSFDIDYSFTSSPFLLYRTDDTVYKYSRCRVASGDSQMAFRFPLISAQSIAVTFSIVAISGEIERAAGHLTRAARISRRRSFTEPRTDARALARAALCPKFMLDALSGSIARLRAASVPSKTVPNQSTDQSTRNSSAASGRVETPTKSRGFAIVDMERGGKVVCDCDCSGGRRRYRHLAWRSTPHLPCFPGAADARPRSLSVSANSRCDRGMGFAIQPACESRSRPGMPCCSRSASSFRLFGGSRQPLRVTAAAG